MGFELNPKLLGGDLLLNTNPGRMDGRQGLKLERQATDLAAMGNGAEEAIPFADYVEGVEEGNETLLSTKEYRFAGFFSRVKRRVGPHWQQKLNREISRRDPRRKIYLNKQRVTVLEVVLNSSGDFIRADVLETSGVKFIDRVAITSFQDQAPFHNPPRMLVGPNGQIAMKFGFIIQVDAPPLYELLR